MMFCEIAIIPDGYAEAGGMPAPKNKSRRAPVKRHLPHLAEMYNDLYALSLEASTTTGAAWPNTRGAGLRDAARRQQGAFQCRRGQGRPCRAVDGRGQGHLGRRADHGRKGVSPVRPASPRALPILAARHGWGPTYERSAEFPRRG